MRKKTLEIHIKGRVQGVGFRPFINRFAEKFNIKGEVANTNYEDEYNNIKDRRCHS